MQKLLDQKDIQLLEEKQKRRLDVEKEVSKRKAVEKTVDEMYDWVDELHCEINDSKLELKDYKKSRKMSTFSSKSKDNIRQQAFIAE